MVASERPNAFGDRVQVFRASNILRLFAFYLKKYFLRHFDSDLLRALFGQFLLHSSVNFDAGTKAIGIVIADHRSRAPAPLRTGRGIWRERSSSGPFTRPHGHHLFHQTNRRINADARRFVIRASNVYARVPALKSKTSCSCIAVAEHPRMVRAKHPTIMHLVGTHVTIMARHLMSVIAPGYVAVIAPSSLTTFAPIIRVSLVIASSFLIAVAAIIGVSVFPRWRGGLGDSCGRNRNCNKAEKKSFHVNSHLMVVSYCNTEGAIPCLHPSVRCDPRIVTATRRLTYRPRLLHRGEFPNACYYLQVLRYRRQFPAPRSPNRSAFKQAARNSAQRPPLPRSDLPRKSSGPRSGPIRTPPGPISNRCAEMSVVGSDAKTEPGTMSKAIAVAIIYLRMSYLRLTCNM